MNGFSDENLIELYQQSVDALTQIERVRLIFLYCVVTTGSAIRRSIPPTI